MEDFLLSHGWNTFHCVYIHIYACVIVYMHIYIVYVCVYIFFFNIFFLHSSIDRHLGCFHILAIVNTTTMSGGISLWYPVLLSFGCILKSEIGSYSSPIFKCLTNPHTLLHSEDTSLHPHQQCTLFLFSLYPPYYLLSLVFLIIAILTSLRWYVTGLDLNFPDD